MAVAGLFSNVTPSLSVFVRKCSLPRNQFYVEVVDLFLSSLTFETHTATFIFNFMIRYAFAPDERTGETSDDRLTLNS